MASVNKVLLIGNLGKDPEVRAMANGCVVTTLNLATTDKYKDRNCTMQEQTEWHRVVLFGKQAEIAERYLMKGSSAYIEGRLQTRSWQDQSGQTRYTTEIVCDRMQMLGSGKSETVQPEKAQASTAITNTQKFDDWDIPFDEPGRPAKLSDFD